MNRSVLKERAKQLLKNRYWMCVAICAIPIAIETFLTPTSVSFNSPQNSFTEIPLNNYDDWLSGVIIAIIILAIILSFSFTLVLSAFVTNQLQVGSCRFFLKYRRNNPVGISEIFRSYKDKTFLNIAKITLLRDLYVGLFSLIFIVPGIIKALEYWAVNYILCVRPDIDKNDAFELSYKLTDGHRGELFLLELSFFGWGLLSVLSFGVAGVFYVFPYMQLTYAEYFSYLRSEAIKNGTITPYDIPDYEDYIPVSSYYPYYPPEAYSTPEQAGYMTTDTIPAQPQNQSETIDTHPAESNDNPGEFPQ